MSNGIFKIVSGGGFASIYSSVLFSHEMNASVPILQHNAQLLTERGYGFSEALQITALVIAILGVVGTIAGYFGFKWLRKELTESIREEVRYSECVSLTDLGMRYYVAANRPGLHPDSKVAALNSAIAVTEYAYSICEKLDSDHKHRGPVKALIGTNVAYFLADLSPLPNDKDLEAQCKERISYYLNAVAREIQVLERIKYVGLTDLYWYNVLESGLSAEFRTTDKSARKTKILERIDVLLSDASVPASWRHEIEEDWEKLRKG